MTRILAFSDIHGAVPAVEALVRAETGQFDAVVIAGDIGPQPEEFFRALEPFHCPVLYVYGNWDCRLAYHHVFHDQFIHLHGKAQSAGELTFIGFSGCPTQWGHNPHWLQLRAQADHNHRTVKERKEKVAAALHVAEKELDRIGNKKRSVAAQRARAGYRMALERLESVNKSSAYLRYTAACNVALSETQARNRSEMLGILHRCGESPGRVVAVTHERLYRLHEDAPGLGAHFFGHRHGFKVSKRRGTVFVNVSALDPWAYVGVQYGVIEWTHSKGFQVTPRSLPNHVELASKCLECRHQESPTTTVTATDCG